MGEACLPESTEESTMTKSITGRYTRSMLLQLLVVVAAITAVVIWQHEFLAAVYLENQVTNLGKTINGSIGVLFFAGMVRLIQLFFGYMQEEQALEQFEKNLRTRGEPLRGIKGKTMIGSRFLTMKEIHKQGAVIDQSALAATLVAAESSRTSFLKFVNNVLILTGVFGTIVSLSIALLGATDMLGETAKSTGLETIIHGMSTALSTTMTAIIAYFVFGYFYLKLTDTLTAILGQLEELTTKRLMPQFEIGEEKILTDYSDLLRSASQMLQQAGQVMEALNVTARELQTALQSLSQDRGQSAHVMKDIRELLREGFRLQGEEQR